MMAKDLSPEKEAQLKTEVDKTWSRYRVFIVGLTGLYGEILAAHLAVEAELEERLGLLIAHPDALLERSSYTQKIALLSALWPGEAMLDGETVQAMKSLGAVRNAIAHGRPEADINRKLDTLLRQHCEDDISDRVSSLRGLTMKLCGYLVGITDGVEKAKLLPPADN